MSDDAVSLIKRNLSLAQLIGRYTKLERKGQRLSGCCPLHNEKTPSFYVDENKGYFHCFGCGKGGDLISFIMEKENFEFMEALDFLADLAGVELPKRGRPGPGREVVEALRNVYAEAGKFYVDQLKHHKPARDYLLNRGIRESTLGLFKLGYAPSQWDALWLHLKAQFPVELLVKSGLFKESKRGSMFDIFRDRVMFPITDAYANPIAFGGRLMEGEGPKYINSPESPLYTKGKHLYNLQLAKAFAKKSEEIIVVEGYMDAIQVYQAGVGSVIAGLGTAFTPEQARLLKRHARRVVLNFDGDSAGFKAARGSIETCLDQDLEIAVITLPDNQDPDDFVKANGVDAYREQLAGAVGFYDFLLNYLSDGKPDTEDPRVKSHVVQEMAKTFNHIPDPVVASHYKERLAEDLRVGIHVIEQVQHGNEGRKPTVSVPKEERRRVRIEKSPFNIIEKEFLFQVMHHGDILPLLSEEHRLALPKILQNVFHDRPWLLEFINRHEETDFNVRLGAVPEHLRANMAAIYFSEAFIKADAERLDELFAEILRQMLQKLVRMNRDRLRRLPPHEEEKKKQLMRLNSEMLKQFHQL